MRRIDARLMTAHRGRLRDAYDARVTRSLAWGRRWRLGRFVYALWNLLPYQAMGRWRRWCGWRGGPRLTVLFYPDYPRTDHHIHRVCIAAGWRITSDPTVAADYVIALRDRTIWEPDAVLDALASAGRVLNYRATDISKQRVERAHLAAFGYGMAVDPTTYEGPMVRKSNDNARKDVQLVQGPIPASDVRAGMVYQLLIDSVIEPGLCEELRLAYFCGAITSIQVRRGPKAIRFSLEHGWMTMEPCEEIFSPDEIASIRAMLDAMGFDLAECDLLRDRPTGRLYLIDPNTNAAGPSKFIRLRGRLRMYQEWVDTFVAVAPRYQ